MEVIYVVLRRSLLVPSVPLFGSVFFSSPTLGVAIETARNQLYPAGNLRKPPYHPPPLRHATAFLSHAAQRLALIPPSRKSRKNPFNVMGEGACFKTELASFSGCRPEQFDQRSSAFMRLVPMVGPMIHIFLRHHLQPVQHTAIQGIGKA